MFNLVSVIDTMEIIFGGFNIILSFSMMWIKFYWGKSPKLFTLRKFKACDWISVADKLK